MYYIFYQMEDIGLEFVAIEEIQFIRLIKCRTQG